MCDISQDCPAGLNFANEDEASSFRNAVNDKIQTRQRRRETTRQSLLLFFFCNTFRFIYCNNCTVEMPKKCSFNQLFNAYLGLSITCGSIFCDL